MSARSVGEDLMDPFASVSGVSLRNQRENLKTKDKTKEKTNSKPKGEMSRKLREKKKTNEKHKKNYLKIQTGKIIKK